MLSIKNIKDKKQANIDFCPSFLKKLQFKCVLICGSQKNNAVRHENFQENSLN